MRTGRPPHHERLPLEAHVRAVFERRYRGHNPYRLPEGVFESTIRHLTREALLVLRERLSEDARPDEEAILEAIGRNRHRVTIRGLALRRGPESFPRPNDDPGLIARLNAIADDFCPLWETRDAAAMAQELVERLGELGIEPRSFTPR